VVIVSNHFLSIFLKELFTSYDESHISNVDEEKTIGVKKKH
jgi:hypothetical protein